MFLVHADPLRGKVGGSWALEIKSFWALQNGIELIGPKKLEIFSAQPPSSCQSTGSVRIKNHSVQGRLNHRCIGSFMYKSP